VLFCVCFFNIAKQVSWKHRCESFGIPTESAKSFLRSFRDKTEWCRFDAVIDVLIDEEWEGGRAVCVKQSTLVVLPVHRTEVVVHWKNAKPQTAESLKAYRKSCLIARLRMRKVESEKPETSARAVEVYKIRLDSLKQCTQIIREVFRKITAAFG
jgi:hypothetical protein